MTILWAADLRDSHSDDEREAATTSNALSAPPFQIVE